MLVIVIKMAKLESAGEGRVNNGKAFNKEGAQMSSIQNNVYIYKQRGANFCKNSETCAMHF